MAIRLNIWRQMLQDPIGTSERVIQEGSHELEISSIEDAVRDPVAFVAAHEEFISGDFQWLTKDIVDRIRMSQLHLQPAPNFRERVTALVASISTETIQNASTVFPKIAKAYLEANMLNDATHFAYTAGQSREQSDEEATIPTGVPIAQRAPSAAEVATGFLRDARPILNERLTVLQGCVNTQEILEKFIQPSIAPINSMPDLQDAHIQRTICRHLELSYFAAIEKNTTFPQPT